MSFQVHSEPKHLSLREIKLARYLISSYSGTRTVQVHSATHADPAYRRSNAGQRLQHTLSYNPHALVCMYLCVTVFVWAYMCVCVCATERKKKVKEGTQGFFRVCQQQWSGCFLTVIGRAQEMHHDVDSHS